MATYMPSEQHPLGCELTLTLIFTPESFGGAISDPFSAFGIVGEPCYAEVDSILYNKIYCKCVFPTLIHLTKAHLVSKAEHKFAPYGRTAASILSASHLIVHTYPERRAMVVSVNVCTDEAAQGLRQMTPRCWKLLLENSGHALEFCDMHFHNIPTGRTTSKLWAAIKQFAGMVWKAVTRHA